jgi:hypothetical protein
MRSIVLLFCMWACMGLLHAADLLKQTAEPPETEEEEHWRRYFGPVTEAEKEVFPDWRAERREQYKDIVGNEAVAAAEVIMSGDLEWYSRPMLEKAARKREEDAAKLPKPEPPSPHTPEAQVVIAKIKAAYAQLDNYHEKVRIWDFSHGWPNNPAVNRDFYAGSFFSSTVPWTNKKVYDGELWYSRALGTRAHVELNWHWSRQETNIWMEKDCVSQLIRQLVRRNVEQFYLNTTCENAGLVFAPALTRYYGTMGSKGIAAQLLVSDKDRFPEIGDQCRTTGQDILFCLRTNSAGLRMATIIQYDVATYLITHIRWDGDGASRGLAEYSFVDAHTEISSDSLRYEVPVEATVWLAERQAEIDAYREQEAEESLKRLARANPTGEAPTRVSIPDVIAYPIANALYLMDRSQLKPLARSCDFQAFRELQFSIHTKTDSKTRMPWSQIYEQCRIEMTPPIVYQTPPVFAPCPDWIKTCEEQLP